MRRLFQAVALLALLASAGCRTDYDIQEVAPTVFIESSGHDEHSHSAEEPAVNDEDEASVDEHMEESHAGHVHSAGDRNHGTQWFFNQPWAAPFIWGKLLRDALIFLVLAAALFVVTGRRKNR
jgi:hypothetical protein